MKLPKQINKLLQRKNSQVASLITHARQLEFLNNKLLDLLPSPLPHHCQLAKIDQQTLIIVVDSPSWSARLRYSIPELLAKLKHQSHHFISIRKIEIKVIPKWTTQPRNNTLKPKPISKNTAQCLKDTAVTIENNAIRNALLKMAAKAK